MNKLTNKRSIPAQILIMIFALANIAYVLYRFRIFKGDFDLRWMEDAYFIRRINPFDSISGGLVLDGIGKIPSYAGSMPWAYPLGCLLVFPFFPREIARICGVVLYLAVAAAAGILVWRKMQNKSVPVVFALIGTWAMASTFMLGNYGGLCCLLIIITMCIYRRHPVAAGLILSFALVKPQVGGLFVITYLLLGQWIVVAVAAALCIAAWVFASIWIGMDPVSMLLQIWQQSGTYENVEINTGLFTFLRNFGVGNGVILISSAVVGITIMTICFFRLRPVFQKRSEIVFLPFLPAILLEPSWFYSHPFDTLTLALIPVILFGYSRRDLLKNAVADAVLTVGITLQCMYGYIIWEKGAVKVLRMAGLSEFWSRDISLLCCNLIYIAILFILMHLMSSYTSDECISADESCKNAEETATE